MTLFVTVEILSLTRARRKRLHNLLDIPMLSEVNKVFNDNPIFVFSLLYFVPNSLTPRLF